MKCLDGGVSAPPQGPGKPSYVPWGAQNVPAALYNAMVSPLFTLNIKLAIFDQAEHNLATRGSRKFRYFQDQMVRAWRKAWGGKLHVPPRAAAIIQHERLQVDLQYLDSLGEMMRLSQSDTNADVPGTTTTVTIDLADLHSPYGSVHN